MICGVPAKGKNSRYLLSVLVVGEVDKAESSRAAPLVLHHSHAERPPWKYEDDQSIERSCDKFKAAAGSSHQKLRRSP